MFAQNAGAGDRLVRFLIGLVLLGVALGGVTTGAVTVVAVVVAIVMLATAALGYCPLYAVLDVDTCGLGLPKPRT